MFVGQTGVGRVIERTCSLMKEHPGRDVRDFGAIPLDLIQRYINFWAASSTDLFGSEVSSNSANFFRSGIKGRAYEEKLPEHQALEQAYKLDTWANGRLSTEEVPLRNAMNEVLRDAYLEDNEKGIEYWNRICAKHGNDFRFTLPHRRFNRRIGMYAEGNFDPQGNPIDAATFESRRAEWLPSAQDKAYVRSLMVPCTRPGEVASWIAQPPKGIDGKPFDYEYVKL